MCHSVSIFMWAMCLDSITHDSDNGVYRTDYQQISIDKLIVCHTLFTILTRYSLIIRGH